MGKSKTGGIGCLLATLAVAIHQSPAAGRAAVPNVCTVLLEFGIGFAPAKKPSEPAEKSAEPAKVPAPLILDKQIRGQTVKLAVGQQLDVNFSECVFLVAIGGDSMETDDTYPRSGRPFRFRGVRPGRTRVVLLNYAPIPGRDATDGRVPIFVDFTAEVAGPGTTTAADQVPLLLFHSAGGHIYTVPVGRRIELDLRNPVGPVTRNVEMDGKSVRHDVDPKFKTGVKFTAVAPGRTVIDADGVKVTIDVTPAAKGRGPDAF